MPHHAPATSPGADLERDRLSHRAARIERVLAALRDRAVHREQAGQVPAPLVDAIRGFERELANVRGARGR